MKGNSRRLAAAGAASLLAAMAAAAACIPDLPADEPPPTSGCGDGFIDLDAGEQCDPGLPLGTGGCTVDCKMQCNGLVWSENDHCYELAAQTTSFVSTAEQTCSDLANAHVATFASEEEFDTVAGFFQGIDGGPFWVGIDDGVSLAQTPEPGWTRTCPGCYAHASDPTMPLPTFADTLPDGAVVHEACVAGFTDTRFDSWEQYPCSGPAPRLHVVCEREPGGRQSQPCDAGVCIDLVLTHATKRYVYVPTAASAEAAEQQCVSLGGTLVVLRLRDEREQLWLQLSRLGAPPPSVWIGLAQQGMGGDGGAAAWVWDDGTPAADYPPIWGSSTQPAPQGQTRAFLWSRGTVFADNTLAHNDDQPQLRTMPFVCELPVGDGGLAAP